MDDKTTVIEQSIEEMGNKSRKVIFFTLTHGVTLSTTVANLEKKKHKEHENATRNQPCYLLYPYQIFLFLYYKRYLENIHKKTQPTKQGLVKDRSPELKVSNPQRIIMQGDGKKSQQQTCNRERINFGRGRQKESRP